MQLSCSAVLQNVENLAKQGLYPQAYQAVLNDLNSQNLTLSTDDQDVLNWLADAAQINSGATTIPLKPKRDLKPVKAEAHGSVLQYKIAYTRVS